MQSAEIEKILANLPLGGLRVYDRIGSTNDIASKWAESDAPDLSLVIANEQTAGRGRGGRKWYTPPDSALAISFILKDFGIFETRKSNGYSFDQTMTRITALGSLAVADALSKEYRLPIEIKWPNDVLIRRKKIAGILSEAMWLGNQLKAIILGIGVNVLPQSVPPTEDLSYPATCIATELGQPISRLDLLYIISKYLIEWRFTFREPAFLDAWQGYLAYKYEWVTITDNFQSEDKISYQGVLLGLDENGFLRIRTRAGEILTIKSGEIILRPASNSLPSAHTPRPEEKDYAR